MYVAQREWQTVAIVRCQWSKLFERGTDDETNSAIGNQMCYQSTLLPGGSSKIVEWIHCGLIIAGSHLIQDHCKYSIESKFNFDLSHWPLATGRIINQLILPYQ